MPLFMDMHETLPEGATVKDVMGAHKADLETQDEYGVKYLRYWVDEGAGKIFCLVDARRRARRGGRHHRAPRGTRTGR